MPCWCMIDMTSSAEIHHLALVEPGAKLGGGVKIGPCCHVGADVTLGDGVHLLSHVVVAGHTSIGARTRIFPFASIGHEPQDLKYRGEITRLEIGADCTIREGVTMNPGTAAGGGLTKVGNKCTFLAQAHVAHDCQLGDEVLLVNNVMLGGHCQIGDCAIMGGGSAAHQYVRIGHHAMIGGLAGVENDVIPYGLAMGNRATLSGLNLVGLKRRGFSREAIHDLRRAYRLLFAFEGTLKERVEDLALEFTDHAQVREIIAFIRQGGDRAICMPRAEHET